MKRSKAGKWFWNQLTEKWVTYVRRLGNSFRAENKRDDGGRREETAGNCSIPNGSITVVVMIDETLNDHIAQDSNHHWQWCRWKVRFSFYTFRHYLTSLLLSTLRRDTFGEIHQMSFWTKRSLIFLKDLQMGSHFFSEAPGEKISVQKKKNWNALNGHSKRNATTTFHECWNDVSNPILLSLFL